MNKADFNQTEQILYVHSKGSNSIVELVDLSNAYYVKDHQLTTLKILEFVKDGLTKPTLKELKIMKDAISRISPILVSVRHSVISSNPATVAYVLILQEKLRTINYFINVFSTETAARHWLHEK